MAAAVVNSSAYTTTKRTLVPQRLNPASASPPFLRFSSPCSCFLASSISISRAHKSLSFVLRSDSKKVSRILAIIEELPVTETKEPTEGEAAEVDEGGLSEDPKLQLRPCELYVCNVPRSSDITDLLELFKPFGTVRSVEVSRNPDTGMSRGCGYVTMTSVAEAKAAVDALDGSDVGGREMRVRFSADIFSRKKNVGVLDSAPINVIFESPYKVYVGNLAWSVKPEDLRELFSQFGNIVSTRLLYDRRAGKSRVYGFLSFSSESERQGAISLSGTEYRGRTLLVREVIKKE